MKPFYILGHGSLFSDFDNKYGGLGAGANLVIGYPNGPATYKIQI